jgi:hypothetical protein
MSTPRLLLATLALAGCSGAGTKVVIDYEREATFAGRETYTWVFVSEEKRALYGAPNPVTADRIVEVVDSALTSKGFRRVSPPESPDLLVGFAL